MHHSQAHTGESPSPPETLCRVSPLPTTSASKAPEGVCGAAQQRPAGVRSGLRQPRRSVRALATRPGADHEALRSCSTRNRVANDRGAQPVGGLSTVLPTDTLGGTGGIRRSVGRESRRTWSEPIKAPISRVGPGATREQRSQEGGRAIGAEVGRSGHLCILERSRRSLRPSRPSFWTTGRRSSTTAIDKLTSGCLLQARPALCSPHRWTPPRPRPTGSGYGVSITCRGGRRQHPRDTRHRP